MKLFSVPKTALVVELPLRDEHCPPHVHVENEEVPWEARFEFSFVSNAVTLMDLDPIQDAPSIKTIDRIRASITANLGKCRKEWWERHATQIRAAVYDVGKEKLAVSLKDGAVHIRKAGKGVCQ